MAKTEKVDNKEQKVEKTKKKVNKSSYSKKKKTKKNILNGIAYVQSTFNNTIISIADTNCLLYTSPSPRDRQKSRMPSSA